MKMIMNNCTENTKKIVCVFFHRTEAENTQVLIIITSRAERNCRNFNYTKKVGGLKKIKKDMMESCN